MATDRSENFNQFYHTFNLSFTHNVKNELNRIINRSKSSGKLSSIHLQEPLKRNDSPETKTQRTFVPFLYERDSVGRLLTSEPTRRKLWKNASMGRYPEEVDIKKKKKMRLISPSRRETIGPVFAQYHNPIPWIKRSYSTHKFQKNKDNNTSNSPKFKTKTPDISPIKAHSENVVKKYKRQLTNFLFRNIHNRKKEIKDQEFSKFDILKPEVLAKIRAKNSFGSIKIYGSPSEIEEVLKFNYIREREKEITIELKEISSALQKNRGSS